MKPFLEKTTPSTDGKVFVIKCEDSVSEGILKDPGNIELINEAFEEVIHKRTEFRICLSGKSEGKEDPLPDLSDYIEFEVENLEDNESEEED